MLSVCWRGARACPVVYSLSRRTLLFIGFAEKQWPFQGIRCPSLLHVALVIFTSIWINIPWKRSKRIHHVGPIGKLSRTGVATYSRWTSFVLVLHTSRHRYWHLKVAPFFFLVPFTSWRYPMAKGLGGYKRQATTEQCCSDADSEGSQRRLCMRLI